MSVNEFFAMSNFAMRKKRSFCLTHQKYDQFATQTKKTFLRSTTNFETLQRIMTVLFIYRHCRKTR